MIVSHQTTCTHLGREKPTRPLLAVESACVDKWFNSFYGDVWTADGWLITASFENGVWAVRKGNQAATAQIAPTEVLYSTVEPREWDVKRAAYEAERAA